MVAPPRPRFSADPHPPPDAVPRADDAGPGEPAHGSEPARGVVVSLEVPSGAGFPDSPELVDLADALHELARDLVPGATARTEVTLTAPPSPRPVERAIVVDLAEQRVEADGELIVLARAEIQLLGHLALHGGQVVSAGRLGSVRRGRTGPDGEHDVDVSVRRVRRRLAPHGLVLTSVPGGGYRLESPVTVRRTTGRPSASDRPDDHHGTGHPGRPD